MNEKLINVQIKTHSVHGGALKGVRLQFSNRDELKDFFMALAYNKSPLDIYVY